MAEVQRRGGGGGGGRGRPLPPSARGPPPPPPTAKVAPRFVPVDREKVAAFSLLLSFCLYIQNSLGFWELGF